MRFSLPPSPPAFGRLLALTGLVALTLWATLAITPANSTPASDTPAGTTDPVEALADDDAALADLSVPGAPRLPMVVERNAVSPPAKRTACPAPGSTFIDSWGFPRSGGRRHQGVDMMAPYGTWVLAPEDGWVRQHSSSLGGLSYYLTTPDGTEYFGTHLQSFIGDGVQDEFGWVTAGTVIGTVGSSGNASSPHLHWEVRLPSGQSVNPYLYALDYCS